MRTKKTNSRLKTKFSITEINEETVHLSIDNLEEGKTYQSHTKDIVKIIKIDNKNKTIKFRNISQVCNQITEFKNVNLIKKY